MEEAYAHECIDVASKHSHAFALAQISNPPCFCCAHCLPKCHGQLATSGDACESFGPHASNSLVMLLLVACFRGVDNCYTWLMTWAKLALLSLGGKGMMQACKPKWMPHSSSCLKAATLCWRVSLSGASASKHVLVMPTICSQVCQVGQQQRCALAGRVYGLTALAQTIHMVAI